MLFISLRIPLGTLIVATGKTNRILLVLITLFLCQYQSILEHIVQLAALATKYDIFLLPYVGVLDFPINKDKF